MFDDGMPCSDTVERKMLASAVYAPDWYDGLGVRREYFYFDTHRLIFDAIESLRARAERTQLNFPNVRLELERMKASRSSDMIYDAFKKVVETRGRPTELEVDYLRELMMCRTVADAMTSVREAVREGDISRVREALDAAADAAEQEDLETTYSMKELAQQAYDDATKPQEEGFADLGVDHFRKHLGSVGAGELVTIGARPNVGKSGLVLAMGDGAIPQGTRPGYISLEDQPEVVGPRGLALKSGVAPRALRRRMITDADLPAMQRGVEMLDNYPFWVDFAIGGDHLQVIASMRRLARKGCNLVFIDYLQVMRFREKGFRGDRRESVGYMLSAIKKEGKKRGQAIVLLSQLRRPPEERKRASKRFRKDDEDRNRPDMDELKEAGDIEEKSDIVILMWRDSNEDDAPVWVSVEKGKWGGVGYKFPMKRGNDGVLRATTEYPHGQASTTQSNIHF